MTNAITLILHVWLRHCLPSKTAISIGLTRESVSVPQPQYEFYNHRNITTASEFSYRLVGS